jgi:hypothetical protein
MGWDFLAEGQGRRGLAADQMIVAITFLSEFLE